jgi:hypothetical protein
MYFLDKRKEKKKKDQKNKQKGYHKNDSEKVDQCLPPSAGQTQWSKKNIPSGTWSGQLPRSDHCVACACGETERGETEVEVVSPMPVRNTQL